MRTINALYVIGLICETAFVQPQPTSNASKLTNSSLTPPNGCVTPFTDTAQTQILTRNGANLKESPDVAVVLKDIGYGDFYEFISQNKIWVDKSLLIKKIWEDAEKNVMIITAPARWGKTINLQMIKLYCGIPMDNYGNEQKIDESRSSRYFLKGEITLKSGEELEEVKVNKIPLISTDKKFNQNHLGNHPVIHIEGNFLDMSSLQSFQILILRIYKKHQYLLSKFKDAVNRNIFEPEVVNNDKKKFLKYYNEELISKCTKKDLAISMIILSEILYNYYNERKVMILYDEHESYIHTAFFRITEYSKIGNTSAFQDLLQDFMKQTFKLNPYIERGIITGVLKVQEATFLSGFNNVSLVSIFDYVDFYPFYGIFNFEFDKMAEERGITESLKNDATVWYDGYRSLGHLKSHMYSTYSAAGFIQNIVIQNYWQNSATPLFLEAALRQEEFLDDFIDLLKSVDKNKTFVEIKYGKLKNGLTLNDCKTIQLLQHNLVKYNSYDHKDMFFALLLMGGYATIHENNKELGSRSEDDILKIRLPNKEIRNYINRFLRNQARFLKKQSIPSFRVVANRSNNGYSKFHGEQ